MYIKEIDKGAERIGIYSFERELYTSQTKVSYDTLYAEVILNASSGKIPIVRFSKIDRSNIQAREEIQPKDKVLESLDEKLGQCYPADLTIKGKCEPQSGRESATYSRGEKIDKLSRELEVEIIGGTFIDRLKFRGKSGRINYLCEGWGGDMYPLGSLSVVYRHPVDSSKEVQLIYNKQKKPSKQKKSPGLWELSQIKLWDVGFRKEKSLFTDSAKLKRERTGSLSEGTEQLGTNYNFNPTHTYSEEELYGLFERLIAVDNQLRPVEKYIVKEFFQKLTLRQRLKGLEFQVIKAGRAFKKYLP